MLGDELLDVIHRYPDHVWVFLHEFPALTGARAEQFRIRRRASTSDRVEAVLRAGVESGEFRDLDPWLTARAWLGMHNYTYLWLKPGRPALGPLPWPGRSPRSSCAASPVRTARTTRREADAHGAE